MGKKNEVVILSAVVRIGSNGSFLDNYHAGGITCGIQDDGRLNKYAYNAKCEQFEQHPQGAVFADCIIPNYDKVKKFVKELSPRIANMSKMVAWDIAIDEAGKPLLIEVNLDYTTVDLLQINNGPLFGEYFSEMIAEVSSKQAIKKKSLIFRFIEPIQLCLMSKRLSR